MYRERETQTQISSHSSHEGKQNSQNPFIVMFSKIIHKHRHITKKTIQIDKQKIRTARLCFSKETRECVWFAPEQWNKNSKKFDSLMGFV